jgi:thioredoxin 2
VDVNAEPQLANELGVRGIPALFVFKEGRVVAQQAGLADLHTLRNWVARFANQ